MQTHKIKAFIPYAALEPLGISLLKAGQTDLAGLCISYDAEICAIYDRQAPNFGVSVEVDPIGRKISTEVVAVNKM